MFIASAVAAGEAQNRKDGRRPQGRLRVVTDLSPNSTSSSALCRGSANASSNQCVADARDRPEHDGGEVLGSPSITGGRIPAFHYRPPSTLTKKKQLSPGETDHADTFRFPQRRNPDGKRNGIHGLFPARLAGRSLPFRC
ncbi:hypothetical protein EIQ31_22030 [Agrobacterium deltaense]|nr:hypothetical protein EIQ31_22030 [Agrobacterium deltaense]